MLNILMKLAIFAIIAIISQISSSILKKFQKTEFMTYTKSRSTFKSVLQISDPTTLHTNDRFQGYDVVTVANPTTEDIGSGPVFFEGWAKYFVVKKNSDKGGMRAFNDNSAYAQENSVQFRKTHNYAHEVDILVPDSKAFYFILTEEYLNVLSSRFNELSKTIDVLSLRTLFDITLDKTGSATGGIEDLGNFQEGYCFMLRGKANSNFDAPFKWVICTETYPQKCELMRKLLTLRVRLQIKCGGPSRLDMTATTKSFSNLFPKIDTPEEQYTRWIVLQDWSTCTLACGGGTQTLHRYCLNPSGVGTCPGAAVLTRPCNTQPCTNVTDEVIEGEVLSTQVKIVPISLRPQRYDKCIVKEEDMDIIRFDMTNLKIPPRIPSRVIMNNLTISIFESGSYDSILASFTLTELTTIEPYHEDNNCLKIGNCHGRYSVMCVICNEYSIKNPKEKIEEWIRDIKLFRDQCHKPRIVINIEEDQRMKLLREELQLEAMRKQIGIIEIQKPQDDKKKKIKIAQILAIKTLEKEKKLEERLEKEERMREDKEEEEMKHEYECEEKKKSSLIRAMVEQKHEEKEDDIGTELSQIEIDLRHKVIENRKKVMKKIYLLKLAHERKKLKYRQQISDVKRVLTENMINSEKIGDKGQCIRAMKSGGLKQYCQRAFSTDIISLQTCEVEENFCYICCEFEFGDMHMDLRDDCSKNCEDVHTVIVEEKTTITHHHTEESNEIHEHTVETHIHSSENLRKSQEEEKGKDCSDVPGAGWS